MSENKFKAPMQKAADGFIRELADRTSPLLDFYPGGELAPPINAVTGRAYSGLNRLLLSVGGADPRWFTKNQAREAGYQFKEKARGRQAVYWEFKDARAVLDDQGRPVLDEDGRVATETVERDRPALRFYTLYHASELLQENGQPLPAYKAPARPFSLARLENIIRGSGPEIKHDQRNISFYRAQDDSLHLRPPDACPDKQIYAAELLKTLARASRRQDRLNRPCGPLGSEAYAREELRVALSSMMMAQDLGLPFVRDHNESYAKVWGEILTKDPYELARACRDAERIKEYVMSLGQNLEREQRQNDLIEKLNLTSERGIIDGLVLAAKEQPLEMILHIDNNLKQSISEANSFTAEEAAILNKSPMLWESGISYDEASRQEVYANQKAREKEFWQNHSYLRPTAPLTALIAEARLTIIASKRTTSEEAAILNKRPRPGEGGRNNDEAARLEVYANQKARENEAWQDVAKKLEEYEHQHPQPEKKAFQKPAPEKTCLTVPFKDKEEAKRFGAKWSRADKLWYAPAGTDLGPLARWLPENSPKPAPNMSPAEEFAQALKKTGLILDGPPIMDGRIHRTAVTGGRPGSKDGAYQAYSDGRPNGWIHNHKTGEKTKWLATGQVLTEEAKAALKAEADERRAEQERKRARAYEEVAKRITDKIVNLPLQKQILNPEEHPYLKSKGVKGFGVMVDERGNLLLPGLRLSSALLGADHNRIQTLQTITPEGRKYFEPGGKKAGAGFIIGRDKVDEAAAYHRLKPVEQAVESRPKIYISEGYATGASIFMATENPVVVAFDANNLKAVAMAIREIFPEANITLCADNDHKLDKNVGLEKAQEAAQAVGGEAVAPEFSPEEVSRGLTDFNDLHQCRGLGAVRQHLGQRRSLGRAAAQVKAAVSSKAKSAGLGL